MGYFPIGLLACVEDEATSVQIFGTAWYGMLATERRFSFELAKRLRVPLNHGQ